jgi:hypothetical protein
MPIHMDAYLGYRPFAARVKVTGKRAAPGPAPPSGKLSPRPRDPPRRYARRMRHPGDSAADRPASQGSGRHRDSARRDAPGRRAQPVNRSDAGSPETGPPETGASVFGPGYRGQRPGAAAPGGGGRAGASGHSGAGGRGGTGGHSGTGGPAAWPGGAAEGTTSKGPVRGFPPAPGQPAPLYPPGQFAAWNRMSAARAATPGARPGGPGAGGLGHGAGAGAGAYAAGGDYADREPAAGGPGAGGYGTDAYGTGAYGTGAHGANGYGADQYGNEVYEPDYSALAVSDPAADVTSTQTWQVISDSPDSPGAWTSPRRAATANTAAADPAAGQATADPVATAADAAGAAAEAAAGGQGATPGGPDLSGPDLSGPDRSGPGLDAREPGRPAGRPAGSRVASRAAARGGRPARKGRSRRKGHPASVVLAVCAVLVVAIAAGAFLLHAAQHQNAPATADRSAAAPGTAAASPSPSLGQFGHIASRAADPLPLTVAQLFPATFTVDGVAFSRTTSEPKGTCASAVIGTALQAAVPPKACSQVVRASYLAPAEKAMGTIGVLNLSTAATAAHAGHAADTADFIAQLKGPGGPTRALGQGAGLEEAATKGHYLILIWAQFVNSASPKSPGQQAQLKNFMTQLFDETANVTLSNRMVSGTP